MKIELICLAGGKGLSMQTFGSVGLRADVVASGVVRCGDGIVATAS